MEQAASQYLSARTRLESHCEQILPFSIISAKTYPPLPCIFFVTKPEIGLSSQFFGHQYISFGLFGTTKSPTYHSLVCFHQIYCKIIERQQVDKNATDTKVKTIVLCINNNANNKFALFYWPSNAYHWIAWKNKVTYLESVAQTIAMHLIFVFPD
jgi:hypothetical protein